jgi:hypothetical protein
LQNLKGSRARLPRLSRLSNSYIHNPHQFLNHNVVEPTYHIPEGTVASRLNRAQERRDAHAHERRPTKRQEEELAEWILDMDAKYQTPSHQRYRLMTIEIQSAFGYDEGLDREWLYQFFMRSAHCGSLTGEPRETACVNEATEEIVRAWFDVSLLYRDKYQLQDTSIHNMDVHGLCTGKIISRNVLGATYDQRGRSRKETRVRNSQTRG